MSHIRARHCGVAFFTFVLLVPGVRAAPAKLDLQDPAQRTSYVIGAGIGTNLKSQGVTVDADVVAAGIADAIAGTLQLSPEVMAATMETLKSEVAGKQQAEHARASAANAKAGADYLAKNAKQPGVKTTASGLQYKVLKSGAGATPSSTDTVKVHYRGTLIDGTVFDSSIDRGEPVTFPVTGVIAGWTEALQLMKVGDKWQLTVPSNLAYGERGAGGVIGPNSVLIFDVELLDIEG